MCRFFSGIIKPKHAGVWFDKDLDSHTDIMEKFSIRDDNKVHRVDFVKFEMTPRNNDVFDHNRDNWNFQVDQDFVPDWFDNEKATDQAWSALQSVFKSRFLIGDTTTLPSLGEGRWFVKDSKVKEIKSGTVQVLSGGTVQKVLSGGTVQEVLSGGTVQEVLSGGTVQKQMGGIVIYGKKICVVDKSYTIEYLEAPK